MLEFLFSTLSACKHKKVASILQIFYWEVRQIRDTLHQLSFLFEICNWTKNARKAGPNNVTAWIFVCYKRVRKITINYILLHHVPLSFFLSFHLPREQIGYHRTDLHEIWYWIILRKSVKKIEVTFRYNKNNRYFAWRPKHIVWLIFAQYF